MWEAEEKAKRALYKTQKKGSKVKITEDEEMKSDDEDEKKEKFAEHKAKKHQKLFQSHGRFVYADGYGDEYDEEEDDSDVDDDDEDDLH